MGKEKMLENEITHETAAICKEALDFVTRARNVASDASCAAREDGCDEIAEEYRILSGNLGWLRLGFQEERKEKDADGSESDA